MNNKNLNNILRAYKRNFERKIDERYKLVLLTSADIQDDYYASYAIVKRLSVVAILKCCVEERNEQLCCKAYMFHTVEATLTEGAELTQVAKYCTVFGE